MKRREASVDINASPKAVDAILHDPPQFITNWPYVVRVRGREPVIAEIMLPRFIFKFNTLFNLLIKLKQQENEKKIFQRVIVIQRKRM
jgi:hypothetical protein